ncbi:hypothetical protein [Picosynechococcus sp. PCC 7117]|uniref:hypothetical protein n=1 Tax=Picosynechococcus sp. PCC 7117 TaxID=195498 RepID=UPI0012EECF6F|nr:hypothetical protein [Picosynechococcus sp. PCC 7117]
MSDLKNSILALNPKADPSILEDLVQYCSEYSLKWIPSTQGKGAYFIASQLSEAKGLDVEDYRKNWSDKATTATKQRSSDSTKLAGKEYKVTANDLNKLKKIYHAMYGESLGRINSLLVVDWKRAYSYLVQGSSDTAKDFQGLGAKAIERATSTQIAQFSDTKSIYSTELEFHAALTYLSSLTNYTLKSEVSILDTTDSKCKHRRFDLIHQQPHRTKGKVVTIYELKANMITYEDVINTIEAKQYLKLAKDNYGEHTSIIFVSPLGGSPEALAYVQNLDDVSIMTGRQLSLFLLEKAKQKHDKSGDGYFVESLLPKNNSIIKKLIKSPQESRLQLSAAPSKPAPGPRRARTLL